MNGSRTGTGRVLAGTHRRAASIVIRLLRCPKSLTEIRPLRSDPLTDVSAEAQNHGRTDRKPASTTAPKILLYQPRMFRGYRVMRTPTGFLLQLSSRNRLLAAKSRTSPLMYVATIELRESGRNLLTSGCDLGHRKAVASRSRLPDNSRGSRRYGRRYPGA